MRRAGLLVALALPLLAARADPLAGRIAGAPVECIDLGFNNGPQIVDAHTILYSRAGKRIWRTGPVGNCPSLRPNTTLIVEMYGSQLCHNDRFRVIEPGSIIPSMQCRFSAFTPYDKP